MSRLNLSNFIRPSPLQAGVDTSQPLIHLSHSPSGLRIYLGQILPFAQYVTEATGGIVEVGTKPFNSFYEFYQMNFANVVAPDVSRLEFASRLLPLSLAETDPAQAAKIILSLGVSMK